MNCAKSAERRLQRHRDSQLLILGGGCSANAHSVFSFNNFHLIFVVKARQGLNTGVRKLSYLGRPQELAQIGRLRVDGKEFVRMLVLGSQHCTRVASALLETLGKGRHVLLVQPTKGGSWL